MRVVDERYIATARGGILYDAGRVRKPADELFERAHWAAQGALQETPGGRGSIAILRAGDERWVLRRYRRGGWAAKVSRDRYLWTGAARTRSFAEWRLLADLHRSGLPAPAPVAARYVRTGLFYRADLITEHLGDVRTLADAMTSEALSESIWTSVGAVIAAFHRAGVQHADLNAHNIVLDSGAPASSVHLLDFDRGRRRERGAWEEQVLARLRRSLEKIRRQKPDVTFGEREWRWLLRGYAAAQ